MLTDTAFKKLRQNKIITPKPCGLPRLKRGERFIMRIPWTWLCKAAALEGKAGMIGVALWFWAGLSRRRIVKVSYRDLAALDVSQRSARRGLVAMEEAGLVTVERKPGCAPVVTLCDIPES